MVELVNQENVSSEVLVSALARGGTSACSWVFVNICSDAVGFYDPLWEFQYCSNDGIIKSIPFLYVFRI